jgi:membrane-bound lytic murein transglycosylase D
LQSGTEDAEALKTQKKTREEALYPAKKPVSVAQKVQQQTAKKEVDIQVADVDEIDVEVEVDVDEVTAKVPAVTQQPVTKPTHHIVKQGETLYSISRLYATTVGDVVKWNNLGETPIKIGQKLLIAEPLKAPVKSTVLIEETSPIASNNNFHIVETGETLYQISKKYNVSLEDLQNWNDLIGNNIAIGQKLRVVAPAGESAKAETTTAKSETKNGTTSVDEQLYHTVAAGESMYQISRKYDVTIKDIMQWNNKSDFNVSLGERLLIKKK